MDIIQPLATVLYMWGWVGVVDVVVLALLVAANLVIHMGDDWPLLYHELSVDEMLRMHGWCMQCRKFTVVRVVSGAQERFGMTVPVGLCSRCEKRK